jgi:hypothetical protein
VANAEDVDTCNRYFTAPVEAFHVRTGAMGISTALSAGETSVGVGGPGKIVVKLYVVE